MLNYPSAPPTTLRATLLPDHRTITILHIWWPLSILGGPQNPNITHLKRVIFLWVPKAMYLSMNGIRQPPPNTTKRPKVVWWKALTTHLLCTKKPLFSSLRDKRPLFTRTCQNWLLHIKLKKSPNHLFYHFFNWKTPCVHLWMSKLSTYIQLHPKDATKNLVFSPAYSEPFQPFVVANFPVQS